MSALQFGLTPKMKPLPANRSVLVADQHQGANEVAHGGIAIEQSEELLCFRLRPLAHDEGQLDETRRDIRFEHGAVVRDDRHVPVLLP